MKEVFCHYKNDWVPLGRHKKTCPYCGAEIDVNVETYNSHKVREKLSWVWAGLEKDSLSVWKPLRELPIPVYPRVQR